MINLILLLLVLHYAGTLIFRPKSDVLGCGIFAWAGKKPTAFSRDKFDILGIINETRGVDSCGITIDGEIYAGIEKTKAYRDFVAQTVRLSPKEIPVVIGHTRWSTGGAHDAHNAHPFGFGSADGGEKYAFIGVHNGSLLNEYDLARARQIPTTFKTEKGHTRTKIDSEILLECLYTDSNFKVLSEYNGAAALVFYNVEEPNVIYCYHGLSKKFNHEKEATEERPLFYYREGKNSLYISSIEDSLHVIGGSKEKIGSFDYNTVYKITDGDITKAVKTRISRHGRLQKSNYGSTGSTPAVTTPTKPRNAQNFTDYNYNNYTGEWIDSDDDYGVYPIVPRQEIDYNKPEEDGKVSKKEENGKTGKVIALGTGEGVNVANIYNEPLRFSVNHYKGRVVFNKFRYWTNGYRIEGWFTFVEGFGFYKLGDTRKEAEEAFWYNCNRFFLDGAFVKNDSDMTDSEWERAYIAFTNTEQKPIKKAPIFPFYDGIRVKTEHDLDACIRMAKEGRGFDAVCLSMCSEHPVINISYKEREDNDQQIYMNGELFTGNISPLGSDRIYTVMAGNLTRTRDGVVRDLDNCECGGPKKVDSVKQVVEDLEEEINALTEPYEEKEKEDFKTNDLVTKEIESVFMEPYQEFPKHKRRLQKFLPNKSAEKAINIIDDFIQGTYELVAIEEKE